MGKNEFLSELETSLSVLQEDELRDIISEYEQHIDIKVEKGLTEEEAIADFGSLQELTGEILEAYHVRVDYAAGADKSRKRSRKIPMGESGEDIEKLRMIGERGSRTIWSKVKKAGSWTVQMAQWIWRQVCRPFGWLRSRVDWRYQEYEKADGDEGRMLLEDSESMPGQKGDNITGADRDGDESGYPETGRGNRESSKNGGIHYVQKRKGADGMAGKTIMGDVGQIAGTGFRVLCRGIARAAHWAMDAALWGIRLAWNGCWIMFSLFAGGFGLISLFGMGILAVLLLQGYPLIGVTIGCTGLVFCMFSAAGLGMTLLWRSNTKDGAAVKKVSKEESSWQQDGKRRRIHKPGQTAHRVESLEAQQKKEDGQDA